MPQGGVEVTSKSGVETYDGVVIACHSDEALKLWGVHATPLERDLLGALPYQRNEAVLHRDASLMPKRRLAWAALRHPVMSLRAAFGIYLQAAILWCRGFKFYDHP